MGSIIFTKMRLQDIDSVLEVEKKSFKTPWSRFAFLCELRDNQFAYYLVVKDGNKVIGYGGMWIILNEAHITNIAIDPDYRGKKLGEKLMVKLMDIAKKKGADRMTLEVRRSNYIAKRLYKKLGFEVRGVRKGYYADTNEDALIMWKDSL
ncbi:MAG: [ribosomal protein S18]-alanine N-acetyltransferase [Thermosediminibacterales bacterium]|nr:[ribosomal protein S18]-alanine N-acetyltransferase [Thermosediminibacterales bacterium]MDK2835664.1 [ribosomal protein S18]-alanine N-acetyltransferase [Thermosediminibacterales bacterium]